jgi:hypothetical protein
VVEGDSYRVVLITEDAATLLSWCREVALQASPADAAIFCRAAAAIEAAP